MADRVVIEIPPIDVREMEIVLVGDSPLVCHNWSDKAKKMILDKQMKQPKQGKEAKDPEQDFRDSLYPMGDGSYGFPAVGFKSAAVSACRFIPDIKMTEARGAFHIVGDMVRIEAITPEGTAGKCQPKMREDMVRVGMGTADIRYRGEFTEWGCHLRVRYNANALSPAQIVNLFNTAGFAIGVGEHRPEKDGSWGMFHVSGGGTD